MISLKYFYLYGSNSTLLAGGISELHANCMQIKTREIYNLL